MSKLISIVLPVYNGEKYLRESIESVLAQTYTNWELLILDDCSSDTSPVIAKEYAKRDPRIRYYRNEKNLQLPGNLNRGFSLAQGEYLTWTSDDNRYRPEALKRMAKTLDEYPNVQFVFASCRIIDAEGNEIEYITVSPESTKRIVGINTIGACFLYTRVVYEQIGDYDSELKYVEDFDYWQRICMRFQAVGLREILYEYRWHDGALSSTLREDVFNKNLETMLLKNRPGFGNINWEQKYFYYKALSQCKKKLGENNPYLIAEKIYTFAYFICRRLPKKIGKLLKEKKGERSR